jgi:hypothetical protein
MIIDVHAHYWPDPNALGPAFLAQAERAKSGPVQLQTDFDHYWKNCPTGSKVIIFGGKAKLSDLWQEDAAVARFAAADPERVVGFLSLDLSQPGWREELVQGHRDLGLRGVKLMPMYAGFYPQDREFDDFWNYAAKHGLPVLLHTGTTFISQAPIDCTFPRHLDEVAIRFPEVRIIMAHMAHPFENEAIVVARKHPHVYLDLSALHYRRWQFFHSLMLVADYGVWPKILFGTDFPFTTVNESIDGLRAAAGVRMGGFSLPAEKVEAIIHRNPLAELGL